jgi:DNA-binding NtrC family response regulator
VLFRSFREDLYYRLCIFPIEMPSLKQRKENIPLLIQYFLEKYCRSFKIPLIGIDSHVVAILQECDWSGNVRQLENKIQQGILRARFDQSPKLSLLHLLPETSDNPVANNSTNYYDGKDAWERQFISLNLEKFEWNVSETAKMLGISRSYLNALIKMHNLERKCLYEMNA